MRAALYIRSASVFHKTAEFHDPFMACRTFAEREGIDVAAAFEDAGASGVSSVDRPGFLDLMQAAKTGAFDIVICEGLDRLSRSQADILDILEALRVLGVAASPWRTAASTGCRSVKTERRTPLGSRRCSARL